MAKKKAEDKTPSRGRAPSAENQKRLDTIVSMTEKTPGVASRVIADKLDITTLQCSQLADRLVEAETIKVFKLANGQRTYYPPKGFAAIEKKLIKERDAAIAEREAPKPKKKKLRPRGRRRKPPNLGSHFPPKLLRALPLVRRGLSSSPTTQPPETHDDPET